VFVDEAHNPHPKTLTGLKRLMEVIADGGRQRWRAVIRLSD
jgi:type II secretory pathway predicted ATPase ExeA